MAEQIICTSCGKDSKAAGGKFHLRGDVWVCAACRQGPVNRDTEHSTFPFTTEALATGQRIEVQSIYHLRRLEREYGVQSAPYNQNANNLDR